MILLVVGASLAALAAVAWAFAISEGSDRAVLGLVLPVMFAIDGLILANFCVMRTRVDADGLVVTFGLLGLLRFAFRREQIVAAVARRYRPIREFGGWGIRGLGARRALNFRGDRGVELEIERGGNSQRVMIGTERPADLAGALAAIGVAIRA